MAGPISVRGFVTKKGIAVRSHTRLAHAGIHLGDYYSSGKQVAFRDVAGVRVPAVDARFGRSITTHGRRLGTFSFPAGNRISSYQVRGSGKRQSITVRHATNQGHANRFGSGGTGSTRTHRNITAPSRARFGRIQKAITMHTIVNRERYV